MSIQINIGDHVSPFAPHKLSELTSDVDDLGTPYVPGIEG